MPHPLDNIVWWSPAGAHARFAEVRGRAARYVPGMTPAMAMADDADESVFADVAALAGGRTVLLNGSLVRPRPAPPADWAVLGDLTARQFVDSSVDGLAGAVLELGRADVPDMLALVGRTRPGPFLDRSVEMGRFVGVRRNGTLVAMAGERFRVDGYTEISTVCTDVEHRGQGLASRLVRALVAGIHARGQRACLHVERDNTAAVRLYESMGFRQRTELTAILVRVP